MRGMFFIILAVYLAANFYIFMRGWQALPKITSIRVLYTVLFIATSLGYVLYMTIGRNWPTSIKSFFQIIGSSWFILIIYLLLIVLLIDLLRAVNHFIPFFPSFITSNYPLTKLVTFFSVIGIVLIVGVLGYINFRNPKTINLDITINKNMPVKEVRIVAVSDIHLGATIRKKQLQRYVDKINSLKPDVVLMAGDIVDHDLSVVVAQHMNDDLKKIHAPLGVYGTTGNHEFIGDENAITEYLNGAGIKMLRDSSIMLADSIYIVGRDDRSNHQRKDLATLLLGVDKSKAVILLDHQPYGLEEAEQNGVDLQISGHTHNGQIWPISCFIKGMYELAYGYKQRGDTHYYVSSGLGLWGPKMRIGTSSELVYITLRFNSDSN